MTERSHAGTQTVVAPRQDGRFNGKVAFVTGATSGIGRATAMAFAQAGASVAVTDIDGNVFYDLTGSYGVNIFGNDFYKECIAEAEKRYFAVGRVAKLASGSASG